MAIHQNKTSRRTVLGAIVAIPATAIAAPSAIAALASAPDRTAWERAFAAFREAEAIMEAFDGDDIDPFGAAYCEAATVLIETPAPDHAAFYWKLDHLFGPRARDGENGGAAWCAEYINAIMADADRLLRRS